jgi:protein gp37
MLEEVSILGWSYDCAYQSYSPLDWVICGAESGNNRRPFEVSWARTLQWECQHFANPIPFFGKQDSGLHPGTPLLIDGQVIHEWPASR